MGVGVAVAAGAAVAIGVAVAVGVGGRVGVAVSRGATVCVAAGVAGAVAVGGGATRSSPPSHESVSRVTSASRPASPRPAREPMRRLSVRALAKRGLRSAGTTYDCRTFRRFGKFRRRCGESQEREGSGDTGSDSGTIAQRCFGALIAGIALSAPTDRRQTGEGARGPNVRCSRALVACSRSLNSALGARHAMSRRAKRLPLHRHECVP